MGYGFPPYRGGPMLYADRVGLANVVRAIKRFAASPQAEPGFWEPAPLLARLADTGATFH
jgi:3-hydroxyacyl-CoA dehydrogenase